ncbi:MAG: hypothetical protein MAG431_01796 [Chloroflexi bacterium]|nr:hypothetical protein [Chloroflexota bacterium]
MVSEYDVSPTAWFYRQNAYPTIPYAVYLEMALQPCGFLSAYQGTILPYPEEDFYFRNLDGWAKLHAIPDLRGGTVRNQVRLLSSSVVKGIILQNFAFQLSHKGEVFYEGESSFGYFKEQVMRNQKGLDGGQSTQPWSVQT